MLDEIDNMKRTLANNSRQGLETDSLVKQMSGQNDVHENLAHQMSEMLHEVKTLVDQRTEELSVRLENIEKKLRNAD